MDAESLVSKLGSDECPCIIDVRSLMEYRSGHIPGSKHIPFWGALLKHNVLPKDKQTEIVLTCEHGPRAQVAAAQLVLLGYTRVVLLNGHMSGWRRMELPVDA